MKYTVIFLWLAAATATAQPAAERDDRRWVCVPTEDREWRCGRGDQAPEPRPLPPARPADAPPAGYEPRADRSRLPDYLRESTVPSDGPRQADPESAAADDDQPLPGPSREDATAGASLETPAAPVPRSEPGPEPEPELEAKPEPDTGTRTEPAPDTARFGIQLVAGRDRSSVEAYRNTPGLESLDLYRRTWEDAGGVWHVLLAGRFETVAAARRALNELPETVREAGAWVRPLSQLEIPSDSPREP